MEEKDQDLIERFFRNALSAPEQAELERRAASDAGFRQELEAHREARQAIRLREKADVRAKLTQRGRDLDAQKKQTGGKRWLWLGGGLILLLALWIWRDRDGKPAATKQESPPVLSRKDSAQRRPAPDTPRTTNPADVPAVKKQERPPPVAVAPETRERLFAENFKPYKHESLEPSLRSDEPLPPPEKFRQLYWDGKYPEALAQFEHLLASAKENDNQLFIKAECLMVTGRAGEAAPVLERILKNDRSRYMDAAAWHLALAYLKTGKMEQAKSRLQRISRSSASPWRADADALLKNIQ